MSRLLLPAEKHEHARACPACEGTGVTGDRYEMPAGEHVLLLEVLCPDCRGCGNGDPEHQGCRPEWHAYQGDDDEPGGEPDDGPDSGPDSGDPACWSCQSGRGWYPVQGFRGEGDDVEMILTRVPCGCSESRLVEESADA